MDLRPTAQAWTSDRRHKEAGSSSNDPVPLEPLFDVFLDGDMSPSPQTVRWAPPVEAEGRVHAATRPLVNAPRELLLKQAVQTQARADAIRRKRPVTLEHLKQFMNANNVAQPQLATFFDEH